MNVDCPEGGMPRCRFSASPASVRRRAPLAGQHTREVLAEAGLAEAEIARLEAAGVLTSEPVQREGEAAGAAAPSGKLSAGPAAAGTPAPPG